MIAVAKATPASSSQAPGHVAAATVLKELLGFRGVSLCIRSHPISGLGGHLDGMLIAHNVYYVKH